MHWALAPSVPILHILREQKRNLRLQRVDVLDLIYQQVGESLAEVVADLQVIPQEVSGPDQQVLELGDPLLLSLAGVLPHEVLQRGQHRGQGEQTRLRQLRLDQAIQVFQRIFYQGACVLTGAGIVLPVRHVAGAGTNSTGASQQSVSRGRRRFDLLEPPGR